MSLFGLTHEILKSRGLAGGLSESEAEEFARLGMMPVGKYSKPESRRFQELWNLVSDGIKDRIKKGIPKDTDA